ncbi:hypothetical protein K466DRAFT_480156, partial [Polyporus arcularius HHB13444]
LTNYFVNTMITALQAAEWENLLQRVGESATFHLLAETCVFSALPNGCLCQMTGDPIVHLKPPCSYTATSRDTGARGIRRRCVKGYCEDRPPKRLKRTDTVDVGHGSSIPSRIPERFVVSWNYVDRC